MQSVWLQMLHYFRFKILCPFLEKVKWFIALSRHIIDMYISLYVCIYNTHTLSLTAQFYELSECKMLNCNIVLIYIRGGQFPEDHMIQRAEPIGIRTCHSYLHLISHFQLTLWASQRKLQGQRWQGSRGINVHV